VVVAADVAEVPEKILMTKIHRSLAFLIAAACASCASTPELATFETPDQAMHALADVMASQDTDRAEEILGEEGPELLRSGDEVADRTDRERVQQYIREKVVFESPDPETRVALIGGDAWPFPIPLVRVDTGWQFDVEAGVEEIANRRVGRNELSTLATLHEFVDAQREYASSGRDGRPPAFASKLVSTPGRHDGLYWDVEQGQPESPLGPMIADASEEGYTPGGDEPSPYHGYRFRLLTRQGKHAPGGERNYVDDQGLMTRGFALLAWPAKHGNSGVMTFVVGPQGIVYQKDLGPETAKVVESLTAFDPDDSWDPTGD
jgi:hypothetical protein